MTPSTDRRFMTKLVVGLLMILAGIALILENIGLLPYNAWEFFFPTAILLFGFAVLWNRGPLHFWGHVLLFFGTGLMFGALGYGHLFEQWMPLGLVWGGVVVVLRALKQPTPQTCQDFKGESHE